MTCSEMFERLDAYHAGTLPRETAEEVERHLLACDACRADYHFQRMLRSEVARLPREIRPSDRVWQGIERSLAEGAAPAAGSRWWQRRSLLAAAAVLLVAISSAVTALLVRPPGPDGSQPAFQVTEAAYQRAATELAQALELHREELSPAALAVVEHNLRIIDEAIRETQAALQEDPRNTRVAELLWASWEKKIDLLERAAQHAES